MITCVTKSPKIGAIAVTDSFTPRRFISVRSPEADPREEGDERQLVEGVRILDVLRSADHGAPNATQIEAACTQGGLSFVTPDQNH